MRPTTLKKALAMVGGLSNPSKMPSFGYSIPAQSCPLGSLLVNVKGSVCEGCYALKGMYGFKNVKDALQRRLDILEAARDDLDLRSDWVEAMVYILNKRRYAGKIGERNDSRYFRWHDSGDLQGEWHLAMIVDVALRTPHVKHWLPTRELPVVKRWALDHNGFPSNLTVRMSANKVGARLPVIEFTAASGVHVTKGEPENGARECPAVYNDNACGDCRACWDIDEQEISYLKH